MWELDCEESWELKNWGFWTVVLEKTLESPLDCKEIQPVHSKGHQSWLFFGRNDAKAETPILWPPHANSWLIRKDSDAGRDWGQEEKGMTEDEMAGWHHWLDGREFEWTLGVGARQGGLAAIHGVAKSQTRLSDWTELNYYVPSIVLRASSLQDCPVKWTVLSFPSYRWRNRGSFVQDHTANVLGAVKIHVVWFQNTPSPDTLRRWVRVCICVDRCACTQKHECRVGDAGEVEHKQKRGNMISWLCVGPMAAVRQSAGLL